MDIPATVFVAAGAVLAALVAGFFSFLNMISAKESRVSEFRQQWIDGLRNEMADLYASIQESIYLVGHKPDPDNEAAAIESEKQYLRAVWYSRVNFTKIILRFNPSDVDVESTHESKIISLMLAANDCFVEGDFSGAADAISSARDATAALLKSEWERVKAGELVYRRARTAALRLVVIASAMFLISVGVLLWLAVSNG